MSPAHAMTLEEVESKPSKKPKRAIGKDETIKLQKGMAVRYLLKPGELEGDHRRRAHWSKSILSVIHLVPNICNIYFRYTLHIGDQLDTYRYFLYINNISGTRFYYLKHI